MNSYEQPKYRPQDEMPRPPNFYSVLFTILLILLYAIAEYFGIEIPTL